MGNGFWKKTARDVAAGAASLMRGRLRRPEVDVVYTARDDKPEAPSTAGDAEKQQKRPPGSTGFITPNLLEADAVVPQCLDNQFVSEQVFGHMTGRGVTFDDPEVHRLREQEVRTEFIRSLVYSSQVVINRAFLHNNANIYGYYAPGNPDLGAAARLLKEGAIMPFLLREKRLGDVAEPYTTRTDGDKAVAALLDAAGGEPVCLRFGEDEESVEQAATLLGQNFKGHLMRLLDYEEPQYRNLASELFSTQGAAGGALQEPGGLEAFRRQLDELANFAVRTRKVTRTDIYKEFFTAEGGSEALGQYRRPGGDRPFLFQTKKLVDLSYNATLPDLLQRFTFTPAGLPSRSALQDQLAARNQNWRGCLPSADVVTWLRRHFMERVQAGMSLPLLSHLSLTDVAELRSFDEWEVFRRAQTDILNDPLRMTDLLPAFSTAFDGFQRKLSSWYELKHRRPATVDRYANYVTFMLKVGAHCICASFIPEGSQVLHAALEPVADSLVERIPKEFRGAVAKLMIGAYNIDKRRLDRERSYTIELMRSNQVVLADEVRELLAQLNNRKQDTPVHLEALADQGHYEPA